VNDFNTASRRELTPLTIFNPRYESQPLAIIGMIGPVCIDTLHGNSSEGDQMASRALALMNDKLTGNYIKTLSPYLKEKGNRISDATLAKLTHFGAQHNTVKHFWRD